MDRITCIDCGQCNHKGKPSVMRGSMYCDTHYHQLGKIGWLDRIKRFFGFKEQFKDKLVDKFYDKKKGEMNKIKGFRDDYIYR